jgi:hypothetical protein
MSQTIHVIQLSSKEEYDFLVHIIHKFSLGGMPPTQLHLAASLVERVADARIFDLPKTKDTSPEGAVDGTQGATG